jgi:predicted component of type VI protein secretion system
MAAYLSGYSIIILASEAAELTRAAAPPKHHSFRRTWMPLRLRVISDNRTELRNEHTKEFVGCGGTIGRKADNDWVLPDPKSYVSGRHALIDFQGRAYYLVDTSRNGVYVNNDDAPVGRGHPQRLFDGDRLRFGEYDILVEITPGDDDGYDDGMRDSVVRAQLVTEDDSMELQLVDERRLVEDEVLARHLSTTEGSGNHSQLSEGPRRSKPKSPPDLLQEGQNQAVAALLKAAGLKSTDLAGSVPTEVMQNAGQILRHLVIGLTDLLRERRQLKEAFRLSQTIIEAGQNNPLKFSPTVDDALRYLLGDRSESYLSSQEAIETAFSEVRNHEQAVPKAMLQALQDFIERFDPEELRLQFDQGLKRNPLLAGANKLKYWELYEDCYQALIHGEEGKLPDTFSREFARAYEQEVEVLKSNRHN